MQTRHIRSAPPRGTERSPLSLLLWDLKAVQCPRVNLDLSSYGAGLYEGSRAHLEKSNAIVYPTLNAVLCSSFPISGVRLGSDDIVDPELLGITQVSTLRSLGKAMQSYRLVLNTAHIIEPSGSANNGESLVSEQWRAMTTALLASAEGLQVLHLKGGAYLKSASEGIPRFASVILEANQLSCLKELTVLGAYCRPSPLLQPLGRCSETLRGLALRRVVFTSPGLLWLTLFERILKFSRLEAINRESSRRSSRRPLSDASS